MHILQIVPHYVPAYRFGGPLKVAHGLGKALTRAGHDVVVITTNLAGHDSVLPVPADTPVAVDGVTVYYERTQLLRYWGLSLPLWRRIRAELPAADLALVHAHYQFANWAGATLARRAGIPYVVFAHGSLHQAGIRQSRAAVKRAYLRLLEARNLAGARFIAFNAAEERQASLYAQHGVVLPSGVDPDDFAAMPPPGHMEQRFPELAGRRWLLFLGRLDIQQKGLDLLLPAFARLRADHPDLHLVLAGPDEDGGAASLRHLAARLGIAEHVTLTGLIAGLDKAAALAEAHAFVLPSRYEGLSIALLEALYCGRPVLVTDAVGLSGQIQRLGAGVVVRPEETAIFEGLARLADPQAAAAMAGQARALVQREYTWDAIAAQLLDEVGDSSGAGALRTTGPSPVSSGAGALSVIGQLAPQDEYRLLTWSVGRPAATWLPVYRAMGDERAFRLAQRNELDAVVGHRLLDALGAAQTPAHWRASHQATAERIAAYLAELDRVAARLAAEGIALAALKNGGIARGLYPCPGCCPMGDLDVLVEKRHFRRAHQILLEQGYQFRFRSALEEADLDAAEQGGGAEYHKALPGGQTLWLELQWRPVAGRWIRPDQEPPAEALLARSHSIPGTAVRLLAPEDNLLQVALHTAKHSYVRAPGFRLHLDVERIVRAYPDLDWRRFTQQVISLQVKTPVYFSLAIPAALFGTPIPPQVLQRLRPPGWKERLLTRLIQRAGLFDPERRKFSKPGYILFTALLYDDLAGLARGVFPAPAWMRERYGVRHTAFLPLAYARRLADLALRRART